MFATLGRTPILGRAFTAAEDKPGAAAVALISEGLWERRFGRDPRIVGQNLVLSGQPVTVIGVMPKTFHGSWKRADLFMPLLRLEDTIGGPGNRGNHPGIYVIGRLKPGVTVEQARADVVAVAKRLADQYPDTNAKQSMVVEPVPRGLRRRAAPARSCCCWARWRSCCSSPAPTSRTCCCRARPTGRRKSRCAWRSARSAAGCCASCSPSRCCLSLAGALLGILLAFGGLKALVASLPPNVPRADEIAIDGRVLVFTLDRRPGHRRLLRRGAGVAHLEPARSTIRCARTRAAPSARGTTACATRWWWPRCRWR